MKRICVIGQGYIGIPTAMVLANEGFEVIGVDKDLKKIEILKQKKIPFHEKEFNEYSKKIFKEKQFTVSTNVVPADIFIICVPTPFTQDKKCDYLYVKDATKSIVPVLKKGNLVILESTVPFSHAPERLLPGNILYEIIHNDRIIGGIDEKSTQMTFDIYKTFSKGKIFLTDAKTAEMCKLMENTYRDVNIALANEFALICKSLEINTYEAIDLANQHPRVNILNPGPGVGGHCIPIDPWFIVEKAPILAKIIHKARDINDKMPTYVVQEVLKMLDGIKNPVVTILGVAYKPNVDDARETPSKYIIEDLEERGIKIKITDPLVKHFSYPLLSIEESIKDSDCIIYVVNHKLFQEIDPLQIDHLMRTKQIYICGNYENIQKWKDAKFTVKILGI